MSSQGQPIDPVAALAMMGQPGAGNMPSLDPIQALAMGHAVASPPLQQTQPQSDNSLNSFVRAGANAATFNLGDVIAAAGDATIPLDKGSSSAQNWVQRYKENIANQRGMSSSDQSAHPYASLGGSIVGGIANPANRVLGVPQSLGRAILQGTGMGAGYGAGNSVGTANNLEDAAKQTAMGAGLGAAAGTVGYGLGKILTGAKKTDAATALNAEGIPTTIGQSLGGSAQRIEDAQTSVPIFGDAIKVQQTKGIEGLNRASYNRILEPLGVQYAEDGPVGNKGIQKVGELIGNAYDKAYDSATITKSPNILGALDTATDEASNLLPKDKLAQIQANIHRLVNAKFDDAGQLNSQDLQTAKNFFAEQSRVGPTASMEDRAMGAAYGKVVDALKGGISETDPDKGALLNAADKAYMQFARVAQASSSNNASSRGGVFTANQLGQAIRGMDDSTRHLEFARGQAPMQDLAQAGQDALSPTLPDSGTPMRYVMEHPLSAALTSPYWGAGKLLYSNKGQSLAKALLFGAPEARKAIGQIPATMLPGFVAALTASNAGGKP